MPEDGQFTVGLAIAAVIVVIYLPCSILYARIGLKHKREKVRLPQMPHHHHVVVVVVDQHIALLLPGHERAAVPPVPPAIQQQQQLCWTAAAAAAAVCPSSLNSSVDQILLSNRLSPLSRIAPAT